MDTRDQTTNPDWARYESRVLRDLERLHDNQQVHNEKIHSLDKQIGSLQTRIMGIGALISAGLGFLMYKVF